MKRLFLGVFIFLFFIFGMARIMVGCDQNTIKADTNFNLKKEEINEKTEEIVYKINQSANEITVGLFITKKNKIQEIGLEDYVVGVVAAEMPASFEMEALKAQAVAARTYAVAHLEQFGGNSSKGAKGGNLTDTTDCQVYITKDDRYNSWPASSCDEYWEKIKEAVQSTSGQVLTYEGSLVSCPYYFSTSSGNTENAKDVFNTNESYLKSVPSEGEENSPKFKTTVSFGVNSIANTINANYEDAKVSGSKLKKQVKIIKRSEAGTVKEIQLGERIATGAEVRKIFSLTSSNFDIDIDSNSVTFTCYGYGHGVGMSQFGANARAKEGKDYIDILKHYYTGVEIGVVEQ
ncbi:stage II sporulation protein D [Clostridium grantii]|uniref:Stage II sporulation protein D n=1 Tax=Clostridium grantii DSM 8605 TaxID=1121316 RepID=A0A1M5TIN4_9CLOT|nr:stage II sporulation protein D [Clostridium grantii]SHH50549.1 stage II sporulation protein D [Clostridium grantii DSM 8605]